MIKMIMLLIVLTLSSCAVGTVDLKGTGGDTCKVTYWSFLKDIDNPNLEACGLKAGASSSESKDVDTSIIVPLLREYYMNR